MYYDTLKFIPSGPIDSKPALFQAMAWRREDYMPVAESMMI